MVAASAEASNLERVHEMGEEEDSKWGIIHLAKESSSEWQVGHGQTWLC
jgi:hypothetical protein